MTSSSDEPRGLILSRLAFALVLGLLIVRSLMLETIRDPGTGIGYSSAGPGVTTSLVLDWLSLLPALLVLGRRLIDRSFTLRGGLTHVFLALFAGWAMLSTIWADDRFLAFVSSTRLIAAASLFWTITQFVRRWDHVRVIAGLLVGLLLANVAAGLVAQFLDQPDLRAYWAQTREQFLQQRNWSPDSYEAKRFEQKLLAGEFFGFNASPNTLGALIVMFATVAVAAGLQRIRNLDKDARAILLFLSAISGCYLLAHSGSKAAWAALLLGLVLLGVWRMSYRLLTRQRLLAFSVVIALIGLAVVTVLMVGLVTGRLPEDSLNFRWRYWVGAWRIVLAHPGIGVGWANFGETYLPVRLPQAAEEIQDPHDFAVRTAAELGFIGLILLFAWLLSSAWRATKPIDEPRPPAASSRSPLAGLALVLGATWLVSLIAANDASSLDNSGYLIYDGFKRLILVGLIGVGIAMVLLARDTDGEDRPTWTFDRRPATWLVVGLVVAVGLMLLQSSIDIAMFQNAPLMLFVCMIGTVLGIGWPAQTPRRESLPLIALIAGSILSVALLIAGVIPIGLAESRAAIGAAAMARGAPDVAGRAYAAAYDSTYPLNNVDYASRAAEAWIAAGPTHVAEARRWLDIATQADPSSAQAWFSRARLRAYWLNTGQSNDNPDEILADFAHGLSLNPSDASLQVEYADLAERFHRNEIAADAITTALRIDDAMDPMEPERLDLRKPGERDRLTAKLANLRGSPTTAP